jgi:hypothetical protein
MNTRNQAVCAWAGLVGLALVFVGLLLSGYVPAPRAAATPAEIAAFYRDGTFTIRLGLFLALIGTAGWAALVSVVWVQLSHIEGPRPVLAALQAMAGAACYVLLTLFVVLLAAAAFRPERAPESTQLLHDIGWFMAFLAAVPFVLQALATGVAILGDRSAQPAYPRWLGYLGVWVAVLLAPGDVLLFFHTGPFAYDGVISYWIPLFGFGGWMAALSWGAARVAKAESAGTAPEPAATAEAPAQ